jgi:O-antigen/teichoic acid export membrane protein
MRNRSFRDILAIVLGQGLALAGVAIGTRIITEYVSTQTYGKAKLLIGISSLFSGILVQPFNQFSMREYRDAIRSGDEKLFERFAFESVLKIALFTCLLVGVATMFYDRFISAVSILSIIALFLIIVGDSFYSLESSILISCKRQLDVSILQIINQWGVPFIIVLFVYCIKDEVTFFLLAQGTFLVGIGIFFFARRLNNLNATAENNLLWREEAKKFVIPLLGVGVLNWIVNVGDRYILEYFHGASAVGIYSAAYGLMSTPFLVLGGMVARYVYPFWYKYSAEKDVKSEENIKKYMLLTTVIISFLGVILVMLFKDWLALILLSRNYRGGAIKLMPWIAGGYALLIVAWAFDISAYAKKKTKVITISYCVAAGVNILLNILLIPRIGALGAAISTFITFLAYLTAMVSFSFKAKI